MDAVKMAAIVLIVAGVLGLAYGSFTYTKQTHEANLRPIQLLVRDKETVNVPVLAGVGAIVIGGAPLLSGSKKRQSLYLRSNTMLQPALLSPLPVWKCFGLRVLNLAVTSNHRHHWVNDLEPDLGPRRMHLMTGRTAQIYNQCKVCKDAGRNG